MGNPRKAFLYFTALGLILVFIAAKRTQGVARPVRECKTFVAGYTVHIR